MVRMTTFTYMQMLTCPQGNTAAWQDTYKRLFPLISLLSEQVPISMSSLFSSTLLQEYCIPRTIQCSDLELSDRFFCAINTLYVRLYTVDSLK